MKWWKSWFKELMPGEEFPNGTVLRYIHPQDFIAMLMEGETELGNRKLSERQQAVPYPMEFERGESYISAFVHKDGTLIFHGRITIKDD